MVSTPGNPPYSPPSPETLHAVIAETLSDFPNKSLQQRVTCLREIIGLLMPLLKEVKEGLGTGGSGGDSSGGGLKGSNMFGLESNGPILPTEDQQEQEQNHDQQRKGSVISQMSGKVKGIFAGKKPTSEKKDKQPEEGEHLHIIDDHRRNGTRLTGLSGFVSESDTGDEISFQKSVLWRKSHVGHGDNNEEDGIGKPGPATVKAAVFNPPPGMLNPSTEDEVVKIMKKAYADNAVVRVVGAGHSVSPAIYEEDTTSSAKKKRPVVLISLTRMRNITIDDSDKSDVKVTAEGGCNIGVDPGNPESTRDNSLVYTINQAGYALPDLGGITHQTVSGFAMTGSSGGNIKASLVDVLFALRFVDGMGKVRVLSRTDPDPSDFFAAGVSMGLFGVVTSVTFSVQPNFFITGTQTISSLSELNTDPSKGSPIDILGPGTKDIPSMQQHLERNEFTRCLWWPQDGLNRLTIWQAKSLPPINPQSGENWTIEPYEELPRVNGSSELAQVGGRTVLIALNLFESDNPAYRKIAATLLGFFNPITEPGKPQVFTDWWYTGIPMDNEISDTIFPVAFTELWFPISDTQLILNDLHDLFTAEFNAIGNFSTEIYAAKKSPFWMSPSHEGDVVRLNVNYFSANPRGSPEEFYSRYWRWFDERGRVYRCHWGKYLPPEFGNVVGQRFTKHGQWLQVREKMDPKQSFVTPYWRSRLAIPAPGSSTASKVIDKLKDVISTSAFKGNPAQTPGKNGSNPPVDAKKSSPLRRFFKKLGCFRG